jgi:hypothetical protein
MLVNDLIGLGVFLALTLFLILYTGERDVKFMFPTLLITGSIVVWMGLLDWWLIPLLLVVNIVLMYLARRM